MRAGPWPHAVTTQGGQPATQAVVPVTCMTFKAPTKTKLAWLRPNQLDRAQESTKGYQEEHQTQT